MDYKSTSQSAEQEKNSTIPSVTNESAKARVKIAYIAIGAILLLVAVGIVTWYFINDTANSVQSKAAITKTSLPALTDGNTNVDIKNDIDKIPSDSTSFAQDKASISNSINGL